ncbi:MAG: ThiF family adenylyltransferase [Proteobacteria bacterium]|nr:ThiF family adenylyltransferase [Pseudomonadota bacterium]
MKPTIAIVGAGGLGGPIAYALAGAGARLSVCDHDRVELSNLQRQIQFSTDDVGRRKVDALADELSRRGHDSSARPGVCRDGGLIERVDHRFTAENASSVLTIRRGAIDATVDVLVDGSDDFATKFAVNDQAIARRIPFVIASVLRWTGQIFAFDPAVRARADQPMGCYRCLFEEPPEGDEAEQTSSCRAAGVVGAAVAVIAGLAARAAWAMCRGENPLGRVGGGLWVIDDLRRDPPTLRQVRYAPRLDCTACGSLSASDIDEVREVQ